MTRQEYKDAIESFKQHSAFIREATAETIMGETESQKADRIAYLLLPANYGLFFNYYLGKDTPIPLADSNCSWYHLATYQELYAMPFITQFRLIFRGGAKSIHGNVGNVLALKQCGLMKFYVVVGINELRAKLLLADLQAQFESNQRIINDFGPQVSYGNWADGMFETSDRSYFMALGLDQPFRGLRHYANRVDLSNVDDCEDRKVALNPLIVRERREKITGDLAGAYTKNSGRMIISNNFIVKGGLISSLLENKGLSL